MAKNESPLSEAELRNYLKLLGPPPVLTSENLQDFEQVLYSSVAAAKPRNGLEVMTLRQAVCSNWFAMRCQRHGAAAIERYARQASEFRAQRAKLRKERRAVQESREVAKLTETPTDVAQLVHLERNFEDMVDDTDTIFESADLERDHNKAFYQSIAFQGQLNALADSQIKMASSSLQMFDFLRMRLGESSDEVPGNVVESNCKEVKDLPPPADSPSIVPSAEGDSTAPRSAGEASTNGGA